MHPILRRKLSPALPTCGKKSDGTVIHKKGIKKAYALYVMPHQNPYRKQRRTIVPFPLSTLYGLYILINKYRKMAHKIGKKINNLISCCTDNTNCSNTDTPLFPAPKIHASCISIIADTGNHNAFARYGKKLYTPTRQPGHEPHFCIIIFYIINKV